MKLLPELVIHEFKERIFHEAYHPRDTIDTLKARLTAVSFLGNHNPDLVRQAEAFLQKTSVYKEEDSARLQQFSAQVKTWDELDICSTYTYVAGRFLEYKLSYTALDDRKQTLHFHAQYKIEDNRCYFISQTQPQIRIIGDPILQKAGVLFPTNPTAAEQQALRSQIECAKSLLIQTGGAGIAANQCAAIESPYQFAIVGVFYDNPEHVEGVKRRYPNANFPPARVMVNPVITEVSQETQNFNHGCLSVPCPNRCAVTSPMTIRVTYLDPLDEMRENDVSYTGTDAVVLWHELTHIVSGKTYMDVTFEALPVNDLLQFYKLINNELRLRKTTAQKNIPELTVPPFHFSVRIDNGVPRLDSKVLEEIIPKISDETLMGLSNQAHCVLKSR